MPTKREIARRHFLIRMAAVASAAYGPTRLPGQDATVKYVTAKTSAGEVQGSVQNGINVFKGVPYAGAPVGPEHRFRRAPKLQRWKGVRDALRYGAQSLQPLGRNGAHAPDESEDCLFVNIWTPGLKNGKRRPIMVYNNPGAGSGNGGTETPPGQISPYDGWALAKTYDVVTVTYNNRMGAFGYLYLNHLLGEDYAASGNAGSLDIVDMLIWLRENAENFGGDANNIMLFGESGGSGKTNTLLAMPSARGLFHKTSSESSGFLHWKTKERAEEITGLLLSKLRIGPGDARDLLTIHGDRIQALEPGSGVEPGFNPVIDGNYLPDNPGDIDGVRMSKTLPSIYGNNKDETTGTIFLNGSAAPATDNQLKARVQALVGDNAARVIEVYKRGRPGALPTDLFVAITTGRGFWMNVITLAEHRVALRGAAVWMYQFTYESEMPISPNNSYPRKAAHGMDLGFKFNHPDAIAATGHREERFRVARNMSHAWTSFAYRSDPNNGDMPRWPIFTLDKRSTMLIDAECKVVDDPHSEERKLWEEIGFPGEERPGMKSPLESEG